MIDYYFHLENIIQLEVSVVKMGLSSQEAIELDKCIRAGLPFFFAGHESFSKGEDTSSELNTNTLLAIVNSGKAINNIKQTETGKRILQSQTQIGAKNKLAISILNKMVERKRSRVNIGEELYAVATKLQHLVLEAE
jgi:hypothetical protein